MNAVNHWLIEILLPLRDNDGNAFPQSHYADIRKTMTEKFGGLTAFTRAPAEGLWQHEERKPPEKDDIVIFEVMAEDLNRTWWMTYRKTLEDFFLQEEIVIRAQAMTRL